MGSIIRFARPRPVVRQHQARVPIEQESREVRRSLFVLTGSFFLTATVMCAAVVAMVSSTWMDVIVMSAFVLVFALLKIVLANALIFTMLRYDAATLDVSLKGREVGRNVRLTLQQPPVLKRQQSAISRTSKRRIANLKPGAP